MNDYVLVLVSAALVSHLLLQRQPVSRLRLHVFGLACAVTTVLGVTGAQTFERWIIEPWQWQDLRLFVLLPWLALLAWGVPQVLAKLRPQWPLSDLPEALLGNVLVLGVVLQVLEQRNGWLSSLIWGIAMGLGFWLALALFDDLRQRSEQAELPSALRGLPIDLLGAGVMAMAFSGLNGLFAQ
ncbi:Electron transport complex protein RnfA [compost metagenome]